MDAKAKVYKVVKEPAFMSMGYLLPPQRLHPHLLPFPVPSRAGGAGGEDFSVVYCGGAEVFFVFGEGEAAVEDYAADVGVGGEERWDVVRGFVADAAVGAAFALGAFDDVPEREPVGEDEAVARVEAGVGRFAPCAVDYFPEFILRVRVVACFGERADAGQRAEYQYF